MKSSLDVIDALYNVLDVQPLKSMMSGQIYSGDYPNGNQLENITIKTLSNSSRYLQTGYINLNIHIPEISSGRPNLAQFKKLVDEILPLVNEVYYKTFSFQIDDDKGIFKDQDQDNMYFYNIKLKFQTI